MDNSDLNRVSWASTLTALEVWSRMSERPLGNWQLQSPFLPYLGQNLSYGLLQDSFGNGRARPTFLNSSILDGTQYRRSHVPWKEGCPFHTLFLRDQLPVDLFHWCRWSDAAPIAQTPCRLPTGTSTRIRNLGV